MMATLLMILAVVSLLAILLFSVSQAFLALSYRRTKAGASSPGKSHALPSVLPRVLVQLPVYNERYVVRRLLQAISKLDYPDELLTIQLLDDSTDDTTAIAKAEIAKIQKLRPLTIEHVRREGREGFKAMAMQYGLSLDDSEFVVVFDSDFLPNPSFIKDVIGYFSDPAIGMVQTRWEHINANYSILTRLMAIAIDNHFSVEQGGRQQSGCLINFNGTSGMWRRKTIDAAGGWSSDCLTEDLDLSFRAQLAGWKFLFAEEIATPAELPTEMQAVRSQQARWTKGAVETSKKNIALLWRSSQGLTQKLVGSFHMLNSSIFVPLLVFGVSCALLFLVAQREMETLSIFVHVCMAIAFISVMFTYWTSQRSSSFHETRGSPVAVAANILVLVVMITGFSFFNAKAALEGFFGKASSFVRTPKLDVTNVKTTPAVGSNYRSRTFPTEFFFEAALSLLFIFSAALSVYRHSFCMLDIFAVYAIGFSMVSFLTVHDYWQNAA